MKWISVKDRLPYTIGNYLVYFKEQDYKTVAWAFYNSKKEWIDLGNQIKYKNITHWMPLPTPPE